MNLHITSGWLSVGISMKVTSGCASICCSVLQCVAVMLVGVLEHLQRVYQVAHPSSRLLQCVAVCCSV